MRRQSDSEETDKAKLPNGEKPGQGMDIDIFQIPSILRKRWLIIAGATVICIGLGGAYAVMHKPSYSASADILVDQQGIKSDAGEISIWGAPPTQPEAIVDSQIFVLQSRAILEDVVKKLKLTEDPAFNNPSKTGTGPDAIAPTVTNLQKAVAVTRNGQSFILRITVKHGNADRAADIANAIAASYLANVTGARSQAIVQAAGAFQNQAKELRERVFKAEAELEKFKATNGLVSTGQNGLLIDQQVEGINRQLIAARGDLEQKKTTFEQARSLTMAAIEAGAIPEAMQSSLLTTMRQKLSDFRSKETELGTALGANHPQMKAIHGQVLAMTKTIEGEVQRLRQSMKSAYERSQANYDAINAQLEKLKLTSIDSSEAGIGAKQLQSEVDALRALYKTFLTRAEQFGPGDSSDTNYSRIISPAVPLPAGTMSMKILVLVAASLFGVAFGSFLAVIVELLTPGGLLSTGAARRQDDVEDEVYAQRLPIIASLPMGPRKGKGLNAQAHSQATQIGLSRTAETLLRAHNDQGSSTVLVLSADDDGAGTSLVADIAGALNRLDKDVLFSDGAARTDKAGANGRSDVSGGLAGMLRFERLERPDQMRPQRHSPTYKQFRDRSRAADFVLIDGTGEAARLHLSELLHAADAILLVTRDKADSPKIDRLTDALSPWQDVMLGTILIGEAA